MTSVKRNWGRFCEFDKRLISFAGYHWSRLRNSAKRPLQRAGLLSCACAVAAIAIVSAQAATEVVLHNFGTPPKGAYLYAGLIRDSAGNLYGTTYEGGASGAGVVFKVNPAGHLTVLHSFTGGADGGYPYAGLIRDSAGNLYGTTYYGGTSGAGVVFELSSSGQETVLYNFTGGADGGGPGAALIRDSAGNLYSTAYYGGSFGYGTVFELSPPVSPGANWTEKVLHSFAFFPLDGNYPNASLVMDAAGNLYSTTSSGGIYNRGTVFELMPSQDGNWTEKVLHQFNNNGQDGDTPYANVTLDAAGNVYGTTYFGGTFGKGVVFQVSTTDQETVLYSFTGKADGGNPYAGVIRDSSGNLYGVTVEGGPQNGGVVFKLDTTGQETVVYGFTFGNPGQFPYANLIRDSAGNLYGTTSSGGPANVGVVFELDTAGQETLLYTFPGLVDGFAPTAGLIRDSAGNLYGTTIDGGTAGAGVLFKLAKSGKETVLHTFGGYPGPDGGFPGGAVVRDSAGNLYGTTEYDAYGWGMVYEFDTAGQETVLYTFTGEADGRSPTGTVVRDSAGNLYGTTFWGGDMTGLCTISSGCGVVFKVDPTGHETVLYSFTGGADGGYPQTGMILDSAGNLYGTTQSGGAFGAGVVFKINTSGKEKVLYSFTGGADGGYPHAGVIRDSAGNLYGTTQNGGAFGAGVVFKVNASGQETVLYSFTGGTDGGYPYAGVIRDSSGNLYGTANSGGTAFAGVVYEVDTAGQETVLYNFSSGGDGGYPYAGVIRDSAGNLYGTTQSGGTKQGGVVFEIKP